jgi:hypothetical protein
MANAPEHAEWLFERALALAPDERAAFLTKSCRGDPQLRDVVEKLLDEDARAGSFLNRPLFGSPRAEENDARTVDTEKSRLDLPPVQTPHPQFSPCDTLSGRFLVVRFIAKGGMGEVTK